MRKLLVLVIMVVSLLGCKSEKEKKGEQLKRELQAVSDEFKLLDELKTMRKGTGTEVDYTKRYQDLTRKHDSLSKEVQLLYGE